jgi:hypothetical protein
LRALLGDDVGGNSEMFVEVLSTIDDRDNEKLKFVSPIKSENQFSSLDVKSITSPVQQLVTSYSTHTPHSSSIYESFEFLFRQ